MICYHGTNKISASSICKEGFNADTWFATHMEDALKFGGPYIFGVDFKYDPVLEDWQFHHLKPILSSKILFLYVVTEVK